MKIKQIIPILTLAVVMAACGGKQTDNTENGPETSAHEEEEPTEVTLTSRQMETVGIKTGQMEKRSLGQSIRVSGQLALDPQSQAVVSPLAAGVIRSFTVHEGNRVKAGQVVAYLENTEVVELQRSYLTALREMEGAVHERARQQQLMNQGAGVKKTLQQAESAYAVAHASVLGLGQQLRQLGVSTKNVSAGRFVTRIPVKSPISGVVGRITVSVGSYADMQTSLMTVVDPGRLHCDLRVFEKDIPYLRVGQTVDLVLTNDRNVHMQGRIYDINSAFDDNSKAVKVHASLPVKPGVKLMPDMFVTGLINVGRHEVTAMPDESIVSKDGKKYIFQLVSKDDKGQTFKPVEVVTGVSELGYTQVTLTGDRTAGDVYVKKNAFYISSMMEGDTDED